MRAIYTLPGTIQQTGASSFWCTPRINDAAKLRTGNDDLRMVSRPPARG